MNTLGIVCRFTDGYIIDTRPESLNHSAVGNPRQPLFGAGRLDAELAGKGGRDHRA